MSSSWATIGIGIVLLFFGIGMTAVSGAMPGAKPLGPPPNRLRIVFIVFGSIAVIWGIMQVVMRY